MEQTENEIFSNWLLSLPIREYKNARNDILQRCGISRTVLSCWRTGRTKIPKPAKHVINEIAGQNVFEL